MTKRFLVLLLLAFIAVSFVPSQLWGEPAELRIAKFKATFRMKPREAFKILTPLDEPELVTFTVGIWIELQDYGYYFDQLIQETLMTTESGAPLDCLHKQMMSHDKAYMRSALAKVVGQMKKEESREVLILHLKREAEAETQEALIQALCNYGGLDVEKVILKFTDSGKRPNVRLAAVDSLGLLKSTHSLNKLIQIAKSDKLEIRYSAIWALGQIGGEKAHKLILSQLSDKDATIRTCACLAASDIPGKAARMKLVELLEDKNWQVVTAAVNALKKRNEIESVIPLIKAMQKVKGKMLDDFQDALETITGYKFGTDPENWKDWLEESGGKIERNPTPRPNELPYVTYHKIKTHSLNMLFIIDTSGSMLEKVTAGAGGYLGEGAKLKGDTKLDFAKAELTRTIESLPEDARFDIITFANEASIWRGTQTQADKRTKKAAAKFIDSLKAEGGTNIHDALQLAFGKLHQDTGYYPQERDPDTIFMLSDGMPSVGPILLPDELLLLITRLNRVRQLTINTIGVGEEATPFLKPLAENNSGKFTLIAK